MTDELCGAEEGQPAIALEVLDCERRWDAVLTAPAARWLHSADVARLDVGDDLAWGCPAQTGVGPMQGEACDQHLVGLPSQPGLQLGLLQPGLELDQRSNVGLLSEEGVTPA
jgi:hypothetical protein